MTQSPVKIEFVSDITFNPIAKGIKKKCKFDSRWLGCDISQHIQRMTAPSNNGEPQVLIMHCTREFYLQDVGDDGELGSIFFEVLKSFLSRENGPWVILNTVEVFDHNLVGIERIKLLEKLYLLNAQLVGLIAIYPKLRIVDAAASLSKVGYERAYNAKSDLVMKLPYRLDAIDSLAMAYTSILEEIFLPRKKVLALDADNTLWGGILGEDGLGGIKIDPINYPGVVYWRFQEQLKAAKDSGLVLALVSKNNDEDVVEAFSKLHMPLSLDDFTIRRVNWSTKSENICSLAESLNLGLDSIVFIDDNPFEIEQVRHAFPVVDCYRFPASAPENGLTLLHSVAHLSAWQLTSEDKAKTALYAQEVQRQEVQSKSRTLEEYLKSLDLRLEYGINRKSELARISQLTNKTNQFNLTTRRYSELDMEDLMREHKVYDFRIIDKYGDMGIVGICILKDQHIDTFLMSCRALGREVESTMLKIICDTNAHRRLTAEYIKSAKNQMVESFYVKNGFRLEIEAESVKHFHLDGGPTPLFAIPILEVA
jgi:FkbH-like protein